MEPFSERSSSETAFYLNAKVLGNEVCYIANVLFNWSYFSYSLL